MLTFIQRIIESNGLGWQRIILPISLTGEKE